jgi:hypothetical protein
MITKNYEELLLEKKENSEKIDELRESLVI